MSKLADLGSRFETYYRLIDGGVGVIPGILSETNQTDQPSYVFSAPRHVFRVRTGSLLRAGMVIQSPLGAKFIVGDNGPSESWRGSLWNSYRLFAVTGQYSWTRRQTTVDPVTRLKIEDPQPVVIGQIWAALEPLERELTDREMRQNFEQMRLITGATVLADDMVDNRRITKVDKQLGLSIGIVT